MIHSVRDGMGVVGTLAALSRTVCRVAVSRCVDPGTKAPRAPSPSTPRAACAPRPTAARGEMTPTARRLGKENRKSDTVSARPQGPPGRHDLGARPRGRRPSALLAAPRDRGQAPFIQAGPGSLGAAWWQPRHYSRLSARTRPGRPAAVFSQELAEKTPKAGGGHSAGRAFSPLSGPAESGAAGAALLEAKVAWGEIAKGATVPPLFGP